MHVRLIEWMNTSNFFVSMYVFQFKSIQKLAGLQIVQTYDKSFVCLKGKCEHMSSCMLVKYIPFLFVGKYLYIFVYEYERHVYMILCKDIWMPVCNA